MEPVPSVCVRVSLGVGTTRPHEGDEDTREACVSLARAQQQHALEHRATCREGVSSSCASLVVAQYPMYCARPTTKHHPRSLTQPRTPMQRAVHTRKENDRRFTIEISLSISLQPSLHYQPHLGTAPPLVVPTERAKEAACSERAKEEEEEPPAHTEKESVVARPYSFLWARHSRPSTRLNIRAPSRFLSVFPPSSVTPRLELCLIACPTECV